MAQGLTQSLTEMSTRSKSWGVKAACAWGLKPYHLSSRNCEPQPAAPFSVRVRSQRQRGLRRGSAVLVCWDCVIESGGGHGCSSVVSVVCCQVEVSASG